MKNQNQQYHIEDSWSGEIIRFETLKEAKKNARKDEAIWFNRNIVAYGKKEPNIVQ